MAEPFPCAVFFDAAGTLFHLAEPVGDTYARVSAQFGLPLAASALEQGFRLAWKTVPAPVHPDGASADDDRSWWQDLVYRAFAEANGTPLSPQFIHPIFATLYDHFADAMAWRLYPDTLPALDRLKNQTPASLHVLSNFDRRLHAILRGLGIDHYFDTVILSSETGASKPHPRIFQRALAAANTAPENCLHVGDDPRCDFTAAQAAGMRAFLLKRPQITLADLIDSFALA